MMRKFLMRPTLVDERTQQRQLAEHKNKLRHATHAIDCLAPPTYSHLTCKLKKLQLEHERIWKIENENRRLLSRLAEIMNGRAATSTGRDSSSSRTINIRANSSSNFRGGPYRPFAAKVRPAHHSQHHIKIQTNDKTMDDGKLLDWDRKSLKKRPHTVAVMGSNHRSRPTSTYILKPATYVKPSINNSRNKGNKKPVLCGCASRQQPTPQIAVTHHHQMDGLSSEVNPTPRGDVNDIVTDLLFGIQSVQITVKQPNLE